MKKILFSGMFLLAIAGCNTTTGGAQGYNFTSQVPAGASTAVVKQAIVKTGKARRWIIKDVRPNTLLATQMVPGGVRADVEITYSATSYSFYLKNSTGLNQTATSIHRRYNTWIHTWDNDIQAALVARSYR